MTQQGLAQFGRGGGHLISRLVASKASDTQLCFPLLAPPVVLHKVFQDLRSTAHQCSAQSAYPAPCLHHCAWGISTPMRLGTLKRRVSQSKAVYCLCWHPPPLGMYAVILLSQTRTGTHHGLGRAPCQGRSRWLAAQCPCP